MMNKRVPRFPNVSWWCDRCGANLNSQIGFDDHRYTWKCTECGYKNSISRDNIYESQEDYWNQNNDNEGAEVEDDNYFYEDLNATDTDNDDALTHLVGALFLLVVVHGINTVAPYVSRWWHDKAVPSLRIMKGKITGKV